MEELVNQVNAQGEILKQLTQYCSSLAELLRKSHEQRIKQLEEIEVIVSFFSEEIAACSGKEKAAMLQELGARVRAVNPDTALRLG